MPVASVSAGAGAPPPPPAPVRACMWGGGVVAGCAYGGEWVGGGGMGRRPPAAGPALGQARRQGCLIRLGAVWVVVGGCTHTHRACLPEPPSVGKRSGAERSGAGRRRRRQRCSRIGDDAAVAAAAARPAGLWLPLPLRCVPSPSPPLPPNPRLGQAAPKHHPRLIIASVTLDPCCCRCCCWRPCRHAGRTPRVCCSHASQYPSPLSRPAPPCLALCSSIRSASPVSLVLDVPPVPNVLPIRSAPNLEEATRHAQTPPGRCVLGGGRGGGGGGAGAAAGAWDVKTRW